MFLAPVPAALLSSQDPGLGLLRHGGRAQPLTQWTRGPALAQVSEVNKYFFST